MSSSRRQHDHDDHDSMPPSGPEMFDPDMPIWVNKFSEDSARAFVKQLHHQSSQNPNAPIVINIDSFGGEVYSLLTMLSAMESVPNQIVTVAYGKAMSAGAVLLACGDMRYASQHATLMIHEISAGTGGHIADINIQYANLTQLNEKLLKILAKRCKTKGGAAGLKKLLAKERDLYLSAEQAVEFGLIDKIGIPTLARSVSVEWNLMTPTQQGEHNDEQPTRKPPKA
jgi:ATP-dependent Clp protease protease subunit